MVAVGRIHSIAMHPPRSKKTILPGGRPSPQTVARRSDRSHGPRARRDRLFRRLGSGHGAGTVSRWRPCERRVGLFGQSRSRGEVAGLISLETGCIPCRWVLMWSAVPRDRRLSWKEGCTWNLVSDHHVPLCSPLVLPSGKRPDGEGTGQFALKPGALNGKRRVNPFTPVWRLNGSQPTNSPHQRWGA